MNTILHDATFKQMRDFIYEKSGIFIPDTKKYLIESRLVTLIQERNLNGFDDYLHLVRSGSNGNELPRLFDAITTNETYFFREPQQLDVFVADIVPKVLQQNGTKDVRLWSAACSTGEEPYTLAMMIAEKMAGVRLQTVASDLSESVLESARAATYNSYSVRNVPENYLQKYFKKTGQMTYLLDPAIRNSVSFRSMNLVDEKKVKSIRGMDVIFCRNVLIYFDDKTKQKAVSLLYDCLKPGGFLFVGASESLHNVTRALRPVILNKVVVYQKI